MIGSVILTRPPTYHIFIRSPLAVSVNDDLVGVLPLCDRLALCLPLHRVLEGGLSLKHLPADLVWEAHYHLSTHNTQETLMIS